MFHCLQEYNDYNSRPIIPIVLIVTIVGVGVGGIKEKSVGEVNRHQDLQPIFSNICPILVLY